MEKENYIIPGYIFVDDSGNTLKVLCIKHETSDGSRRTPEVFLEEWNESLNMAEVEFIWFNECSALRDFLQHSMPVCNVPQKIMELIDENKLISIKAEKNVRTQEIWIL